MPLTPYPKEISSDSWQVVMNLVVGKVPDAKKATHCGWEAAGYALGQALPDGSAPQASASPMPHAEASQHLASLSQGKALALGMGGWLSLAVTILQLLQGLAAKPTA